MLDVKPWYASKTIWASLIAVATAMSPMFGITLDQSSQEQLSDIAVQLVTVAASLTAIFGRLSATDQIG